MLIVGLRGKEALWSALGTASVQLRRVDLDDLLDSARAQASAVDDRGNRLVRRLGAVAGAAAGWPRHGGAGLVSTSDRGR